MCIQSVEAPLKTFSKKIGSKNNQKPKWLVEFEKIFNYPDMEDTISLQRLTSRFRGKLCFLNFFSGTLMG